MFDGEAFGQQMVEIVRGYVDAELAPLVERNTALEARIAELEARELAPVTVLTDEFWEAITTGHRAAAFAGALKGADGEQGPAGEVDMGAVKALVDEAVSALPPAEKGEPGADVDMTEVEKLIETAVKAAVEAIPAPKDGEPGKDGIGLADVLRDAEGNLVVVMTDGRTKSLGKIDGKDGAAGRDGLGFDDLNVEQIGERTVRFLLKRDADEAEFDVTFPVPIYRGVFKEGDTYEPGDLTTWGGSLWHLNEAKGQKPGAPESGWQLAAKAGRPGKDAGK